MRKKFYLAGKISKNGWRHDIVKVLRNDYCLHSSASFWPRLEKVIFEQFDYTGPYFTGCNHGCTHAAGEHTWAGGFLEGCPYVPDPMCNYYERGGHGEKAWDCDEECDSCPFGGKWVAAPLNPHSEIKTWVTKQCEIAIMASDIVFAWLDSDDAYGTLVELGLAAANSKPIWIATPEFNHEMWFAYNLAQKVEEHPTAKQALWEMTEQLREISVYDSLIESPIEKMFWEIAKNKIPNFVPQVEIGPYRADFAFTDRKILVELDGHDYHKTKEQRTHDAKRDRYLQENGWQVIRFTGSEVYRNTDACIEQTVKIAQL